MENKCYLIDCMNFMAGVPDKAFDLAIVDPFYGQGESASRNNTGNRPTKKWKTPISKKYKMKDIPPKMEYFTELFRVSKFQIIWGGNFFIEYLYKSSCWIVWDKKVNENEHLAMCELAWTSFNTRTKIFRYLWAGFKKEGNNRKKEIRIHPCQKPVALYKWCLKNYAKPGWKILDTHEGSGSHRIACHDMGFHHEGCEIDPDIWKDQESRYQQHIAQGNLFDTNEIKELIYKQNELS